MPNVNNGGIMFRNNSLKFFSILFITFIWNLVLCSCTDPKVPNESNFRAAINKGISDSLYFRARFIDKKSIKPGYMGQRFSVELTDDYAILKIKRGILDDEVDKFNNVIISNLIQSGILIPYIKGYSARGGLFAMPEINTDLYLIKKENERYVRRRTVKQDFIITEEIVDLCEVYYGRKAVGEIISWTEPNDFNGFRWSVVKYNTKLIDAPDWAKNIPGYYRNNFGKKEQKITLELTNKGWSIIDYK